jgi:glutamine synthetase
VSDYDLLDAAQREAGERSAQTIQELGLRTVRMIWVDQHGVPRCKFMSVADYTASLKSGIDFSAALLSMDSANNVFTPLFVPGGGFDIEELTGFPDMVLVPDPTTFRVLPWADRTGWVLTDAYFGNGRPVPIDARRLMIDQVKAAASAGFDFFAGLEVEFYVVRRDGSRIEVSETGWPPPTPKVSVIEHGYQYLSEVRLAGINAVVEALRDACIDLGLPLRSIEDEWGPGQLEITFDPLLGVEAADAMILLRSTAKQVAQNMGLHASFMSRPALPNFMSSGWHLHESLLDSAGNNVFVSDSHDQVLSRVGRQFMAGLLDHALPMTVFSTPTINGYKRFRPYSFAPAKVNWAVENRGAMVRVQGSAFDTGSHLENRLGEPAANPYFYLAANLAAGLDGITRELTPPPPVENDPYAEQAPSLPTSLWEAVDALEKDNFYRRAFGDGFVRYVASMKRHEIGRFLSDVTDWEMREYFEFF